MPKKDTRILSEVVIDHDDEGDVYLVTSLFYQLVGTSWVSYKQEARGYYLSVRTEKRSQRNGYSVVSFELFTGGIKALVEEAKMFSAKKLAALEVDPALVERLTHNVLFERAERIQRRAEDRQRFEASRA